MYHDVSQQSNRTKVTCSGPCVKLTLRCGLCAKRLTGRTRLKSKQINCQITCTKIDVILQTIQHVRKQAYVFFSVLLYKICLQNRIAIIKQSDEKPVDKVWMVQVLFWLLGFSSLSACSLHLTLNRIQFLMIGSWLLLCLRLLSMWCYGDSTQRGVKELGDSSS